MTKLVGRLRRIASWDDIGALLPQLPCPGEAVAAALGDALLRVSLRADGQGLDCKVEVLGALAGRGVRLRHAGWQRLAQALAQAAPAALARRDIIPLLAATAALSLLRGRAEALRWALAQALACPAEDELDAPLHAALWRCGLLRPSDGKAEVAAWTAEAGLLDGAAAPQRMLLLLGLAARRPMPYTQALVEAAALPWLLRAAEAGNAATALALEAILLEFWLKRAESEDHQERWIGAWAPALTALGRRERQRQGNPPTLPAPTLPAPALSAPALSARPGPPRLAFIVHNGVLLAHTEVLLLALTEWRRQGGGGFEPQVWSLGRVHPAFEAAFSAQGVDVRNIMISEAEDDFALRLHSLRRRLALEGVAAAIWLCHPHMLAYALGLGIAPRLAWWSLKYHPPIRGADLLLRQGGGAPLAPVPTRGQLWHIMPLAFAVRPPDDAARAEAARLRAALPADAVVLSTVMREDKLDSPAFWETVAQILRRAPQAVWRYAGRQDLPGLRACMERHGVAPRAIFAGWVDPVVEAALADLYLDGWPVGSGATAAQAMTYGVPYVWRASDPAADSPSGVMDGLWAMPRRKGLLGEAEQQRYRAFFDDGGESLLRNPEDAEAQARWALELIADPALRRRTGAAYARFAAAIVTSPEGLAEGLRRAAARLLEPAAALSVPGEFMRKTSNGDVLAVR
jgi:hypothetical protein